MVAKKQEVKVKDPKEEELGKVDGKELFDKVGTFLAEKSGSTSMEFGKMIFNQLSNCYPKMELEELLSSISENMKNIKPKDHIEGMLAVQMLATHYATMNCFRLAKSSISIDVMNATLNSANKLTRSYTAQMEALNRYRGKGQQKMTVEHVHINSGGQAIIGNVTKNDIIPEGGKQQGGTLKNEE
jgi:hypothetical protein